MGINPAAITIQPGGIFFENALFTGAENRVVYTGFPPTFATAAGGSIVPFEHVIPW